MTCAVRGQSGKRKSSICDWHWEYSTYTKMVISECLNCHLVTRELIDGRLDWHQAICQARHICLNQLMQLICEYRQLTPESKGIEDRG